MGATALVASGMLASCAWAAETIEIKQARLGNIFVAGEVVQIPVQADAGRIDWQVEDFFGTQVAAGEVVLQRGRAVIEPMVERNGYFELHLQAKDDDATLATAQTTYAVIPPPDTGRAEESPFGVMTHFAQGWDTDIIPLIAKAGIRHIRDEQYWDQVELEPGKFVFPGRYTAYMAEAIDHGIEPLVVMSFANDLYDDGATPHTEAGREGYARYGQAILEQYGERIAALEIWNEYNGSFAAGPVREDLAGYYAAMLERAYQDIKAIRPDVQVLGGAAVNVPLPWFKKLFERGGLAHMDGVVIHPYVREPEAAEGEIKALRSLIEAYAGGATKPIWVTEFGRFDDTPRGRHKSAAYLVRLATLLLSQDVERMYWYLLRDYQTAEYSFSSMGLLRSDDSELGRYAPAPAYAAYANLAHRLAGATYVRREPTDPRTHIHLFQKAEKEIRVAWSTASFPRVTFETRFPLTIVDVVGGERTVQPVDGAVEVLLEAVPVYVEGPVLEVREHNHESLLAWSEEDFGDVQGMGGWHYGYFGGRDADEDANAKGRDDFKPLHQVEDAWGWYWGDPGLGPLRVDRSGAHPSVAEGHPLKAVRRWVSSVDGEVDIYGTIAASNDQGDGTQSAILVDGRELFAASVGGPDGPTSRDYNVSAAVDVGSTVDFVVTPGPGSNIDYDATVFSAVITVPIIADSVQDYGDGQGSHNWRYGYYDGDGEGQNGSTGTTVPYAAEDFEPLPAVKDGGGRVWGDPTLGPIVINRNGMHPSVIDNRPVWAVRRWVSDVKGPVRITGTIAPTSNQGDGARALIIVDGATIYEADVGGPARPHKIGYAVVADLSPDSVLDFALTPGPGTDVDFDATTFTATIEGL